MGQKEWNLTLLFNGDDDPAIEEYRATIQKKVGKFVNKWSSRADYCENPAILKEALDDFSALEIVGPGGADGGSTRDAFYFGLRSSQDQNDASIKAKDGKATDFAKSLSNQLRFFTLSISKIDISRQPTFLQDPVLKPYKHFLERTFAEAKYVLTVNEENILSLKSEPAHSHWTKMVRGFLSKEERNVLMEDGNAVPKNFSQITSLLTHPKQEVRDSAASAFNDILAKHVDVGEAEMNAILANKKIDDEIRGIPRPDFTRHLSDDIDTAAVDALLDSVSSRYDISRRFYALKAKLLGKNKLLYHERNVSYGSTHKKYPYEDALNLVHASFSDLDPEFADILKKLDSAGQIDVFPRKGKRAGAFCTDSLRNQPTYVMLNHTDEMKDIRIIAHELGHAINSELMKKNCGVLDCGMVLSTAEVASTFMEDFASERLLKEADDETRLSLMIEKLTDDMSSINRQVAAYRCEQDLHKEFREKGYLSKTEIGAIFKKHMEAYMGEAVEQSPGAENWWVHWHHLRSFFYVYSYASGLLISKALQSAVRKDKNFVVKIKEFLSAGMSASPVEIFKRMDIDITDKSFWDSGMDEISTFLDETERLAKKLNKI